MMYVAEKTAKSLKTRLRCHCRVLAGAIFIILLMMAEFAVWKYQWGVP